MTLQLRAHHLLCLQGYQGYGYSRNFEARMAQITRLVKTTPDLNLTIVAGNDGICDYCPHKGENGCRKRPDSARKTRVMDLKVLERLGITEGSRHKAGRLLSLTGAVLQTIDDLQGICDHCRWKDKCLWYMEKARESAG